jgi:hypothetical protein
VRRALARWIKQQLSAAFNTWCQWYADLIAERDALQRAVARWNAQGLLAAFTWWREGRMESQLELHARAALYWLNRTMAVAWTTWREGCAKSRGIFAIIRRLELRHQAEKEELLEEIERLRKLLMDRDYRPAPKIDYTEEDTAKLMKAVKMWQRQQLARGFNTLKWELQMARQNRSMALKVMTYWCNQQLIKAYNSWREYYFEILAIKRSVGFWKNRSIAAAWNSWVTFVDDLHRQRMSARNAVMRWQYMQLFAGFNTWRSSLSDGIRRKNAMLRAVLRWGGSELLASFGYWRETAEKIRVAELEFRAYLTKSYDPTERSRSRSASPVRQRPGEEF